MAPAQGTVARTSSSARATSSTPSTTSSRRALAPPVAATAVASSPWAGADLLQAAIAYETFADLAQAAVTAVRARCFQQSLHLDAMRHRRLPHLRWAHARRSAFVAQQLQARSEVRAHRPEDHPRDLLDAAPPAVAARPSEGHPRPLPEDHPGPLPAAALLAGPAHRPEVHPEPLQVDALPAAAAPGQEGAQGAVAAPRSAAAPQALSEEHPRALLDAAPPAVVARRSEGHPRPLPEDHLEPLLAAAHLAGPAHRPD
eukprot:5496367-Alexandrium_andersonii.AAC.1